MKKTTFLLTAALGLSSLAQAQFPMFKSVDSLSAQQLNWQNLSLDENKIPGVATQKAYNELLTSLKPKKKIVVAVIDSGVDTEHKDLKGKIWINKDEIPGNGIDDDNNGYIDDINGWNFIGNAKGEHVVVANLEEARIVRTYEPIYGKVRDISQLNSEKEKNEYRLYTKAKTTIEERLESAIKVKENFVKIQKVYKSSFKMIEKLIGKKDYTAEDVRLLEVSGDQLEMAKNIVYNAKQNNISPDLFDKFIEQQSKLIDYQLNPDFNERELIGDKARDFSDIGYGNNDVKGEHAEHGTFVASMIAANRNNQIGIDGIAENVEIMCLRAVPDGDENDKDIALAIRYAVDNGANIINMSFGKNMSLDKKEVDKAMMYAASKNVLLVHAAGNDGKNNDLKKSFPHDKTIDNKIISTWLEVGATSISKNKKELIGSFTNYGKESVDLFAPGVKVIGCVPDNKYAQLDGTSFASPIAAGVAALVWSYYPDLTAVQLKEILMASVTDLSKKKVSIPSDEKKKPKEKMRDISVTGGIINVYNALEMAATKS